MKRERKIKRKSFSIERAAQKTQERRGTLDNQTSSQVNLRVAVSQMNFVVGDFEYNANRIENCLKDATKFGADLILFPELALTGYPPEDLLLKDDFFFIFLSLSMRSNPQQKHRRFCHKIYCIILIL